jgi:glycosyltransferase involved in cell wall biosynthesis
MSATRDCPELWRTLAALKAESAEFAKRFVIRFVGPVDLSIVESITAAGLGDHIERLGRVSHAEAMREMQRARVLLLPINDTPNSAGILPGKVFEYLSVGRPILAVGPATGDIARVLGDAHLRLGREVVEGDGERVLALFREAAVVSMEKEKYSRVGLAGEVAGLLGESLKGRD